MRRTKAAFSETKQTIQQDIGALATDLRDRFRELQLIRQQVRIAQCGTLAPYMNEPQCEALFARGGKVQPERR